MSDRVKEIRQRLNEVHQTVSDLGKEERALRAELGALVLFYRVGDVIEVRAFPDKKTTWRVDSIENEHWLRCRRILLNGGDGGTRQIYVSEFLDRQYRVIERDGKPFNYSRITDGAR